MLCQNTQSYLVYAAYMTSFVLEKPSTGNAYVRVRDVCYEGSIRDSSIKVARGRRPTGNVIPGEEYSYVSSGIQSLRTWSICTRTSFHMIAVLTFSHLHDCFCCQCTSYFYEVTLSLQCLYHLLHISVCSACTRVV